MEKELVDKIMDKKFMELTSSERENFSEWFSNEDEFDQLKNVFTEVERLKLTQTFSPRTETKKSLDELFAKQQEKIKPVFWYNSLLILIYPQDKPVFRRPLIQFAAVGIILLLTIPFLFKDKMLVTNDQIAQVENLEPKEKQNIESANKHTEATETMDKNEIAAERSDVAPFIDSRTVIDGLEEVHINSGSSGASVAADIPTFAFSSSITDSKHPDGIYVGTSTVAYSQAASAEPAIFDLLTAAF